MEKLKIKKRVLLILVLATTFSAMGQMKDRINKISGASIEVATLDRHISAIMDSIEMPGLSIAVINDNRIVYHSVFGVSNAQTKEPVTKKSIFEGASLSKPIFAYFALKMAEEGKLDLDKPLHEYLPHPGIAPQSQEEYKLITARMVLAHQSGFPNHSNDQLIELAFKPGTGFMYSGEAYQYLAAVIGMQNGIGFRKDLNELFQKKVTEPLEMVHTTFVWDKYLESHKVYGHDANGAPTFNKPGPGRWSGETFNAFSSVHSEAYEYAKFIVAMLKREGLSNQTFDDMLKEHHRFKEDNPIKQETGQTGWGLGFAQKPTPSGMMHMHTGNNHDFQAYAMFIPEEKYGVVLFTNSPKMAPFIENLSKVLGPLY